MLPFLVEKGNIFPDLEIHTTGTKLHLDEHIKNWLVDVSLFACKVAAEVAT
jgi:hypothetical protein